VLHYPGSAAVLQSEQMVSQSNIIDQLSEIPGFELGYSLDRQVSQRFSLRGIDDDNRLIIMQDGIGKSTRLFSGFTSSFRTDMDILKRVEVVKGASSILHGSGAIGGVIAMQTKRVDDFLAPNRHFGAMLGGRIESNNMHSVRGAAYARGYENFPLEVLAYAKHADYGKIRRAKNDFTEPTDKFVYNDEQIDTAFFTTGLPFGDSHRMDFSWFMFREKTRTLWQPTGQNTWRAARIVLTLTTCNNTPNTQT